MLERSLATVRSIGDILPIPDADKIEAVRIDGWECVVKKGDFQVGDSCVYFEIDSVLPAKPVFEFMAPKKYKVKTIRLRGQISQGLAMPLRAFPEIYELNMMPGANVTDVLGIKHIDDFAPATTGGNSAGSFPGFIRKTNQERVQNIVKLLHHFVGIQFEVTEKIDGTSLTTALKGDEFIVCSHNLKSAPTFITKDDPNTQKVPVYWQMARKYELEERLRKYGKSIALQGEIAGPGIQKNRLNLTELGLYIFDIWNIDEQRYFNAHERYGILDELGLKDRMVPIIHEFTMPPTIEVADLIKMADGKSLLNPECLREGLVFKAKSSLHNPMITNYGLFSFKVISNEYLLKYGL